MFKKMLLDQNGKPSSKRLIGVICTLLGIVCYLITWGVSLATILGDARTALEVCRIIFIGGLGILGISVVEFLGTKKGKE